MKIRTLWTVITVIALLLVAVSIIVYYQNGSVRPQILVVLPTADNPFSESINHPEYAWFCLTVTDQ